MQSAHYLLHLIEFKLAHRKAPDIVDITMDRYFAPVRNAVVAPYQWLRRRWMPNDPAPAPAAPIPIPPEAAQRPPSTPPRPSVTPTRAAPRTSPKRKTTADEDALQHLRKTKRTRKADPIDEFLAMIEEAVDRDVARQDIEYRLKGAEEQIDAREKLVEELEAFVKFLEGRIKDGIEDLDMALETNRAEIARHQAEMKSDGIRRDLPKRRLGQSRRQMEELFGRIYEGIGMCLGSLGEGGRMGTGTVVAKAFTRRLREMADCVQPLAMKMKQVARLRKEFLKVAGQAKTTGASPERGRKISQRQKLSAELRRVEKEYAKQSKHQHQREAEFLRDVARPWLIETGRMHSMRRASAASSTEDVAPYEPSAAAGATSPVPKLDTIRPDLGRVLHGRREVARWRTRLRDHQLRYSQRLADYLYANPNATKEDLDAVLKDELKGRTPKEMGEALQKNVRAVEKFYADAQQKVDDAGIRELPLPAAWAGSNFDVSPIKASTLAPYVQAAQLDNQRRRARRWYRKVARTKPTTPKDSPDGKWPPSPLASPPTLPTKGSPAPSSAWEGPEASTLTESARKEWLERV